MARFLTTEREPQSIHHPERRRGPYARRAAGIRRETDWGTVLGLVGLCWAAYVACAAVGLVPFGAG